MTSITYFKHEYWKHPSVKYKLTLTHEKDCLSKKTGLTIATNIETFHKWLYHFCLGCSAHWFSNAKYGETPELDIVYGKD